MKKHVRILSTVLALALATSVMGGCGTASPSSTPAPAPAPAGSTSPSETKTEAAAPDTITALLPPISSDFLNRIDAVAAEFNKQYPNLTLKIESASWDDRIEKLDTQVNAGSPPDIAFLGSEYIAKYVDMGVAMDIGKYADPAMIADYDTAPIEYMKNGSGIYGFPAYMEIHGIGGNKEYMDKAGLDWKTIQTKGWSFEQFAAAVKSGVGVKGEKGTSEYGLVFATAGTTTKNYLEIFAKNGGMPSEFTTDMKYAYTSKKFLSILTGVSELINNGANMNATAGERWNMFLTGKTMFTGKGLATFENNAKKNNEKIATNNGAVEASIPVDYAVMPVPTSNGASPAYYAVVDGYITFRGKKEPTEEHMKNVAKAAYFLASGPMAAQINAELFAVNICKTARDAEKLYPVDRDAQNLACVEMLMKNAAPARPDIPSEKQAAATKLMDEVIVPKFQALLAKEATPQQVYDELYKAAVAAFGEDGVVKD